MRPLGACIFMGFRAQKTISSYSFDRIVLIFGYIVERTNTKTLSSHFFAISISNPNYDVINDVISGFAKVVVERCSFHYWITQRISCSQVVSIFLYLLQFPSYDVINDVIMSDADCTPGREPRSVAASLQYNMHSLDHYHHSQILSIFVRQMQENFRVERKNSILALWIWKKLLTGFREK